jgi:hypothetical protein
MYYASYEEDTPKSCPSHPLGRLPELQQRRQRRVRTDAGASQLYIEELSRPSSRAQASAVRTPPFFGGAWFLPIHPRSDPTRFASLVLLQKQQQRQKKLLQQQQQQQQQQQTLLLLESTQVYEVFFFSIPWPPFRERDHNINVGVPFRHVYPAGR